MLTYAGHYNPLLIIDHILNVQVFGWPKKTYFRPLKGSYDAKTFLFNSTKGFLRLITKFSILFYTQR